MSIYAIIPVSTLMICTAFLIVELRNLKYSTYSYIAQALLLVTTFLIIAFTHGIGHLYIWAASALITKAILIPWLVLLALNKTGVVYEERAVLPLVASIIVDCCLTALAFALAWRLPLPEALKPFRVSLGVSLTLFFMGIWGMVSKGCAVKQTICLCHLENGIHLLLALLAYATPVTVEIGILTDAIFAVAIMLYLAMLIKSVTGSLDTYRLCYLRW